MGYLVKEGNSEEIGQTKKLCATIEGWLSAREMEFLYRSARNCDPAGVILEIGSFKGKSTVCLAKGSRAKSQSMVYAIDPHTGTLEQEMWLGSKSSFQDFEANIARAQVSDLVVPVVKKSLDAAKDWNKPISLLWIDGNHTYEGAKLDFELFNQCVVDGGVIAFHDSTQGELPKVVSEVFGRKGFTGIKLIDSITYARKEPSNVNKSIRDRITLFTLANYAHARSTLKIKSLRKAGKWIYSKM